MPLSQAAVSASLSSISHRQHPPDLWPLLPYRLFLYLLSVPLPSVYTTTTAVAIGSSTTISVITTSSTPPASTIFSDSSGFKTRRDSEGLIGGVIGGVLASTQASNRSSLTQETLFSGARSFVSNIVLMISPCGSRAEEKMGRPLSARFLGLLSHPLHVNAINIRFSTVV
ncbi:uncharacterized protein EI90DRAFT_3082465 [Cantharellus anzutake]|uniref:uncharacterized protein n=1 Tax=Cantharellus anzutake TaxID=1750568 RepID=UPI001906DAC0|nr:uncharacterized protein EI90DRAFT_3082465 [Cantharellus anzutake]KAF8319176.1 hypothetical protein EI90DRAFT_3082465 [Cantharellus anzutake]